MSNAYAIQGQLPTRGCWQMNTINSIADIFGLGGIGGEVIARLALVGGGSGDPRGPPEPEHQVVPAVQTKAVMAANLSSSRR